MTLGPGEQSVALVVPIYNVEQYLAECLESITAQTVFADIQVVLVDDGSSDKSAEIAAAFAGRHDNVTLLRERNQGPGAARNRGLQEVRTDFVAFCDSDDRLPPAAIETLRRVLLEHDADVAVGSMETFPTRTTWPWLVNLDEDSKVVEGVENAPDLIHAAGPCSKLFRTSMLREKGFAFGEGTHFEDVYFTLPVLLEAKRIALTRTVVYHYRQRADGGSIMDSLWRRKQNFWDHLAVEEFLHELRPRVPALRRPVLDLFLVRSFQGFALRAPQVLQAGELRSFFDRAVQVYGHMNSAALSEACLDVRHRLAFIAFRRGDWRLFTDRASMIRGVDAVDGELYVRLHDEVAEEFGDLLRARRSTVLLESLDLGSGGDTLVLRGRFSVDGLLLSRPLECDLSLRMANGEVGGVARVVGLRPSATGIVGTDWVEFEGELPLGGLASGLHRLTLVVEAGDGRAELEVRPSSGALRSARTLCLSTCRVVLLRQGTWAALRVQRGTGAVARLRWGLGRALDDVKHAVKRRPLWRARLARLLTGPLVRSDVWVLGERRDTAQDNSYALFRYLREHRRDIRAYYVIDADSEHYQRIRHLGRVVPHSSLRHRLLMLHARVLVNSYDIDAFLLPRQWATGHFLHYLAWRVGSRRVFLQHGVIYNDVSAALHRGITGLDLFVASAEGEGRAIRSGMAYSNQVVETGLPRFDGLHRGPAGRRILVMPTWRTNLVRPSYARDPRAVEDFDSSGFATFWRRFLRDERLLRLLEQTGTTLEFFAHYEMAEHAPSLVPEHSRVAVSHHRTRSVQEAILDCSLFVTDWSSTFFDTAYAGRPVILAPFDEQEFRESQYAEGYFDPERDGFGPVVRTPEAAVDAIRRYLDNGFAREAVYERRARAFFAHHDSRNCERVVAAIEGMLQGGPRRVPRVPAHRDAAAQLPRAS